MDLLKQYKRLYEQWLDEFRKKNLTNLSQNDFIEYKKFYEFIENFELKGNDDLKQNISEIYKENVSFLFNDLLRMREIKIIDSALTLQEIDLKYLYEAEKLFFQNLVASVKGFQNVKSLSTYEDYDELKFPEIKPIIKDIEKAGPEEKPEGEVIKEEIKEEVIEEKKREHDEVNYKLIRFIEKTPALVGIDLLNYGPFKKEDVANIPSENAKILVKEKFAKFIHLD